MVTACVTSVSFWRGRGILSRALAGGGLATVLLAAPGLACEQSTKPPVPQPTANADAKAIADFQVRLKDYLTIHEKFEATLPKLPDKATPAEMDKHQRVFGPLIQKARGTAKQGDIFTPDMQAVVRRITRRAFSGPDGKQMIGSIMDENPVGIKISINGRYPDEVPLSTMPPDLLAALPKLPPELEFRFVGDRFILLDKHAHLIVDWVDNVLPIKPQGGA